MIGVVTDSNAQLPPAIVHRYAVEVVPIGIAIDGTPYREGIDLDVDEFYARLAAGARVSTSAPPPGAFVEAYEALARRGADRILSIHVGAELSGTFNSARLAVAASPVAVELVDTTTASFALGCCVWEAAEQLAIGASLDAAATAARAVADRVGNVFIVGGLEFVRRSGRLAAGVGVHSGHPVLALEDGALRAVATALDADDALDVMTKYVEAGIDGGCGRVGVGDAEMPALAARLADQLGRSGRNTEVVRYTVGPSVGCHTGPGTVGAVFYRR